MGKGAVMAAPWEKYQDASASPTGIGYVGPTSMPQDGPWKKYADENSPTAGMSTSDKFLAGAGKAFYDVGRGVGQLAGVVSRQDIDEARRLDAPLMRTGAGRVGNLAGSVAAFAPTAFIPGANTATGAALIGGGMGFMQPVGEGESRMLNTAAGAGLGVAGQQGGQRFGQFLTNRLAAQRTALATQQGQNAERDATIAAARDAGYLIPPSSVNPSFGNQVLESISGKIATAQTAANRNQGVTERLARQAVGLPEDAPITREAMQNIRRQAFAAGYDPVATAGVIRTDPQFAADLNAIVQTHQGAARSFPGAVPNDVLNFIEGAQGMHGGPRAGGIRVPEFDAGDALQMIQVLRDRAGESFAAGNNALGRAQRAASTALENQIERDLASRGQDAAGMLQEFRHARQLMARTHTIEDAIREGSGNVNAPAVARELQRGRPLTGELETIGRFANTFPRATQSPQVVAGPAVHNLKSGLSALLAGGGGVALGPVGIAAGAVPFVAPPLARSVLFSRPVQNALTPTYQPGLMTRALPAMVDNEPVNALLRIGLPSAYLQQQ